MSDVIERWTRERRERNRDMLARARRGLQDLRDVTWEAHQRYGILTRDEHMKGTAAYTLIDQELAKLAADPEYTSDE